VDGNKRRRGRQMY